MARPVRGRPAEGAKTVKLTATITPTQLTWLEKQANGIGDGIPVSAVVRACIRHAHADLNSGVLTAIEFEALAR